jgi:putative transposase
MRSGLIPQIGKKWMGKGIKPIIPTTMKFEYCYLYKAVSPVTGENFSLLMPDMTTESMNVFLREFKKHLGKKEAMIVMDNAPSHKSKKLEVPEGIEIKYLPPYSPELNPVERVFQDIRKLLKNRLFKSLNKLEDTLCQIVNSFTSEMLKKLTFYPYIREAMGWF